MSIKKHLIPFDPRTPPWNTMTYVEIKCTALIGILPINIWELVVFHNYILKCVDLDLMQEENAEGYPIFNDVSHIIINFTSKMNGLPPIENYYNLQDISCGSNYWIN